MGGARRMPDDRTPIMGIWQGVMVVQPYARDTGLDELLWLT